MASPGAAVGTHVLFYDGSCGLCRRAVTAIRRRHPRKPLMYVDVNDELAMSSHPQIDRRRAMKRVALLRPDGRIRWGYNAVTGVMRLLPRWRRVYWLMRLWPVPLLGHMLYHAVGQNRHRISRLMGWER